MSQRETEPLVRRTERVWNVRSMGLGHARHLEVHGPMVDPGTDVALLAIEDVERILAETSRYFAGDHLNAGVVVGEVRRRIRAEAEQESRREVLDA